jgi:membrane-associated phospholipid phosphatase
MKEAGSSIQIRWETPTEDDMQTLLDAGIAWILSLQGIGDWLEAPMRFFSQLGTEEFFLLVLPLIYWCVDASIGLRVAFILLTSDMLNYTLKLAFAGPRPYWVSSHVRGLWPETSFGVPSGHAQHAMSVWGIIAASLKQKWAWVAGGLLIFLIGFSRLYLGAHFPHDVLVGWGIGAALLAGFSRYWGPLASRISGLTASRQILLALMASLLFIAVGFSAAAMREDYQVPQDWEINALRAGPAPHPVDPGGIFSTAGTLFGFSVGFAWLADSGGYRASGVLWKRFLRYPLGLAGVLALWVGLGALLPRGDELIFHLLRYLRYFLVGGWVSGGAPWVFMRLGLSERPSKSI